jgi:hypothetical protein
MTDATLAEVRAHLDKETFAEAWEQGRHLAPDDAVALALSALDQGEDPATA